MKRRWPWIAALTIAVLVVAWFTLRRPLTLALVRHHVAEQMSAAWFKHLPDSLNVVLCGAGGPMPDLQRSGPCSIVIAGRHIFVVDSGPGSVRNIILSGVPVGKVEAALLTHYHSDHIGDLGELMMQRWLNGTHQQPLPVYGPPGVAQVVAGFNLAYKLDDGYRTAHHGTTLAPPSGAGGIAHPFPLPAIGRGQVVLAEGGLTITAFQVDHEPATPAVGYRFDYKGRSIVFSGDTRPFPNLVHFAHGADVLVHEGLSRRLMGILQKQAAKAGRNNLATILTEVMNYHTMPVQAAAEAQQAGVRYLLFYHVTPPLPLRALQSIYLDGVKSGFHGPVQIGVDGTWISLPVGSKAIKVGARHL